MTSDQATVGAFLVTAVVALAAALRWLLPRLARFFGSVTQTFETINGKAAVVDHSGREVEPPVPGVQVQLADIKAVVSDQSQQNTRLTAIEAEQVDHTHRLTRLEEAHIERVVTRAESAQAWAAVEAIASQPAGDPPETIEEHNL